jgi:hypothetical protein
MLINGRELRVCRYQYSETNVKHFVFSLLRIKVLYMFRALLAHQEVLHKWHLLYSVCYVSWVHQDWSGTGETPVAFQSWCSQLT